MALRKGATKPPPRGGRRTPAAKDALTRFGDRALRRLAWLMEHAESEQAQVAAAKELLERAHGRVGAAPDDGAGGMEDVVARLRALRSVVP